MKRFLALVLIIIMTMVFTACSKDTSIPEVPDSEGIAPYELSERDKYLLQLLALEGDVNIISFKAPIATKSLIVQAYLLDENGTWSTVGKGQVLLGQDASPEARLEGTFAMLLKDNYAIDMHINTRGRASFRTKPLDVDYEIMASAKGFLKDFQRIELNKEIPVAIMVYDSGTSIRSYSMESFFSPSEFHGMGLVQAVTLTFSDM